MADIMVVKQFSFDAAHHLPNHPGKCKNVHGHRWMLDVGVKSTSGYLNDAGMVIDFGDLKKIVNEHIIDKLDHQLINEVDAECFPNECPTAEYMIGWIVFTLTDKLPKNCELALVRLWETPTSYAEWRD